MQLDGLLTTIQRHASGVYAPPTVLYRSSDHEFAAGYEIARDEHPNVQWVGETDFKADVLSILTPDGLVAFHTDDDLFFDDVAPFDLLEHEVCFSLRLGLNITYSYSLDRPERLRRPVVAAPRVSWDWREQASGSFSYPLALNGHAMRAHETRSLIEALDFSDPNELEAALHAERWSSRPRIASFATSCVVSVPVNVVTQSIRNRHGGLHTPRELNDRFLAGERIAPERMAFNAIASCHQEIPFSYRTRGAPA
jgi:hypothetical protein